jgi:hypothetical protein
MTSAPLPRSVAPTATFLAPDEYASTTNRSGATTLPDATTCVNLEPRIDAYVGGRTRFFDTDTDDDIFQFKEPVLATCSSSALASFQHRTAAWRSSRPVGPFRGTRPAREPPTLGQRPQGLAQKPRLARHAASGHRALHQVRRPCSATAAQTRRRPHSTIRSCRSPGPYRSGIAARPPNRRSAVLRSRGVECRHRSASDRIRRPVLA